MLAWEKGNEEIFFFRTVRSDLDRNDYGLAQFTKGESFKALAIALCRKVERTFVVVYEKRLRNTDAYA